MSSPFAIAAVTAVLKDLLNNGLNDHDLSDVGNVAVTALPPDRIPVNSTDERAQLNLFMYQTTPNSGWRNVGLPSRSASGERLTNPPLALDLHYFLTAYGAEEFHAEVLLGYAMQLFHENPILTRAAINRTLRPTLPPGVSLPPGVQMIATADLADQVEQIKLTPFTLPSEEMSRFWTAMQAKYRPTAAYQVSVVLIESTKPARSPLPVLTRGEDDRGPSAQANLTPPFPTITGLQLPNNQPAALLGDTLTISGHHLAGAEGDATPVTVAVRLTTPRLAVPFDITVPANQRTDTTISVQIPNATGELPAGIYSLSALVTPNGQPEATRATNAVPLLIAPRITSDLTPAIVRTNVVNGLGTATIALTCLPELLPEQRIALVLGDREFVAETLPGQSMAVTFIATQMAAGSYRVRLRVDGVESLLVDRSDPTLPVFDASQQITLT